MKTSLVLFVTFLAFAACKRRSPPAMPPAPQTPPAEPAKAAPAPKSASAAGGAGRIIAGDQNLPALNQALKTYIAKHKKAPAHLDDLAKEGLVPFVPMAPPGMRYELDAARGEVKLTMPGAK
jgi:predicted small lipoprotein YifL